MPESGTYGSVRGAAGNSRPYRECRPVVTYPPVLRPASESPPGRNPRGAGWAACRLWGFGWVAAWVGAAPAGVVCVGPTMAVAICRRRLRALIRQMRETMDELP